MKRGNKKESNRKRNCRSLLGKPGVRQNLKMSSDKAASASPPAPFFDRMNRIYRMDRAPARLIQERSGRETEGPGAQRLPSSLCVSVALCSIKKRRSTKEFSFWRTPCRGGCRTHFPHSHTSDSDSPQITQIYTDHLCKSV